MSEYVKPASLSDAYAARAAHPDWNVIAGCTDVMVGALERPAPAGLIDVFGLQELIGVEQKGDVMLIGAATPYATILRSENVRDQLPMLHACVSEIGAAQIQERGTMGGNIATSSPVGDTLPALLALGATIHLGSSDGERTVPYDAFCTGYRTTALAQNELIVKIEIPLPGKNCAQYWRKVGTRRAQAISKVMVAATAQRDGAAISECRLAVGAVADRPIRLPSVEKLLAGSTPDKALADRAATEVANSITPIDDVRSSATYRKQVAANLARRFVLSLV